MLLVTASSPGTGSYYGYERAVLIGEVCLPRPGSPNGRRLGGYRAAE